MLQSCPLLTWYTTYRVTNTYLTHSDACICLQSNQTSMLVYTMVECIPRDRNGMMDVTKLVCVKMLNLVSIIVLIGKYLQSSRYQ